MSDLQGNAIFVGCMESLLPCFILEVFHILRAPETFVMF